MERCESDVMSFVDYFFPHHWVLNYAFAYQGFIVGTIAGACRFYNHSGTWRCDYIDHFKCKSEILWSPNSSVSAMITEPSDSISLSRWKHPTRERIICAREEKVSFQSNQQSEGSFLPWFISFRLMLVMEALVSLKLLNGITNLWSPLCSYVQVIPIGL